MHWLEIPTIWQWATEPILHLNEDCCYLLWNTAWNQAKLFHMLQFKLGEGLALAENSKPMDLFCLMPLNTEQKLRCVGFCFYISFIYMWSRLDHYWSNVYQQDHRSGCVLKNYSTSKEWRHWPARQTNFKSQYEEEGFISGGGCSPPAPSP